MKSAISSGCYGASALPGGGPSTFSKVARGHPKLNHPWPGRVESERFVGCAIGFNRAVPREALPALAAAVFFRGGMF